MIKHLSKTFSIFAFLLGFALIVTILTTNLQSGYAEDNYVKISHVSTKDQKYGRHGEHPSKKWLASGKKVKVHLWYDITGPIGAKDVGDSNLLLQQCKASTCNEKDNNNWETIEEISIEPKGKNKKQEIVFNKQTEPLKETRLLFKGKGTRALLADHRVSYDVYQNNTIYTLTPKYTYYHEYHTARGATKEKTETHKLAFSINRTNENHALNFEGKVSYTITRLGKELDKKSNVNIRSDDKRQFTIEEFKEDDLPPEWTSKDGDPILTIVHVQYEGNIDGKGPYYINQQFKIQRNKYGELKKLTAVEKNGKVEISAQTPTDNKVKNGKWYFLLKLKDHDTKVKEPKNQNGSAKTSFSRKDFDSEKNGKVIAIFTGTSYENNKVTLHTATDEIKVKQPQKSNNNNNNNNNNNGGGSSNGGSGNGGNNGGGSNNDGGNNKKDDNRQKDDSDSQKKKVSLTISHEVLDNNNVKIKAKLKNVVTPVTGKWTVKLNDQTKNPENKNGSATAEFSTEKITDNKANVTVSFKGEDKNQKIDITETKTITITKNSDDDDDDQKDGDQNDGPKDDDKKDKDQNNDGQPKQDDSRPNRPRTDDSQPNGPQTDNQQTKEVNISITHKILEDDQVEIEATLDDLTDDEKPTQGNWRFTLADQTQTATYDGNTAKVTFSTASIKEEQVEVKVEFDGTDKNNNKITGTATHTIDLSRKSDDDDISGNGTDETPSTDETTTETVITTSKSPNPPTVGGKLPKTATPYPLWLLTGLVFIAGGLLFFFIPSLRKNRL